MLNSFFSFSTTTYLHIGSKIEPPVIEPVDGPVSLNSTGDILAIGFPYHDSNGADNGCTRIYQWNGTAWVQMGLDIKGVRAGDRSGSAVSLNSTGDRVAIGAPYNDGNGTDSGHTRIYQWDGTAWVQMGLDIKGVTAGDRSGFAVSINSAGDRVAIGAPYNDDNGTSSGHTRIYQWDGTAWIQMGSNIKGVTAGDQSGFAVSLNSTGYRVAIGAPYNDDNGTSSGHTRIYQWDGTAWVQMGLDINGEAADDRSGSAVSLNSAGDRVAIGAPYNDGTSIDKGQTKIYQWNGTAWVQMGSNINGEVGGDLFGCSVSLNDVGDRVAIGARAQDGNGSNSGCVKIYSWNGNSWIQFGDVIYGETANSNFGFAVSLNALGDKVGVGAHLYAEIYNLLS